MFQRNPILAFNRNNVQEWGSQLSASENQELIRSPINHIIHNLQNLNRVLRWPRHGLVFNIKCVIVCCACVDFVIFCTITIAYVYDWFSLKIHLSNLFMSFKYLSNICNIVLCDLLRITSSRSWLDNGSFGSEETSIVVISLEYVIFNE